MRIRLLRHATAVLELAGKRLLLDPMLGPGGVSAPVPTRGAGQGRRNPLVELPLSAPELEALLASLDGVLVTHLHFDHFDDLEAKRIPRELPVLCQAEDAPRLAAAGFRRVHPIAARLGWEGLGITRVGARHGGPLLRRLMGVGSGYVIDAAGERRLYVTGDTVWSRPVRAALALDPGVVLANAGAAQLPIGRSITMEERDLDRLCRRAPRAQVVAVHMEAINHCLLGRDRLRAFLRGKTYEASVRIPADGETVEVDS